MKVEQEKKENDNRSQMVEEKESGKEKQKKKKIFDILTENNVLLCTNLEESKCFEERNKNDR